MLSSNLAICGTISPINPMGPQNAVATAVSSPVMNNRQLRVAFTFIPKFSAYLDPNNSAFRGFTIRAEAINPVIIRIENTGNWLLLTPLKLPSPHIT